MDLLIRLLALLAASYVGLCGLLYLVQDRLVFHPMDVRRQPAGSHVQPVSLPRDDVVLHGWMVNPDAPGPLLVYFGGNAEEVSDLVDVFAELSATTLLMNYRGFGASEGRPTTEALVDDARAVVDVLARRHGRGRPLVLFGRSLGSGVAALVARSDQVDGLILMSPFRSLTHLADGLMPWLPVRWLLRHELDTQSAVDVLPHKTLVLYSPGDRIVPAAETLALLRLFPNSPEVVEFDGGHNVPLRHHEIWRAMDAFLASVDGDAGRR